MVFKFKRLAAFVVAGMLVAGLAVPAIGADADTPTSLKTRFKQWVRMGPNPQERQAKLKELLDSGKITQEQYDKMIAKKPQRFDRSDSNSN